MGKYMRKCKGIGEIAVMEVAQVGVTTRARTLAMATAAAAAAAAAASTGATTRRKVSSRELQFSSSYIQLRSRQLPVITPEKPVSPATSENPTGQVITEDRCSSPNSDDFQSSRCSSNGSTELVKESLRSVDLESEGDCFHIDYAMTYSECRQSREKTPSSELRAEIGDLESTARATEANSRHTLIAEKTMPTEAEIEDFFSAAEEEEQKLFTDKYNFDISKDVPLEGRYEWVRIKP